MQNFDQQNRPITPPTTLESDVMLDARGPVAPETEAKPREQKFAQPATVSPLPTPREEPAERDRSASETIQGAGFQALPQNFYNLSYSCLLIPRFSDHFLVGDITACLPIWMKEVCVSYGWRLDALTIRPGFMLWMMTVPPSANPAQFMRTVRQRISARIFNDFPRFSQKNVSNDFWAPGYFVVPGNQPPSPENINSFILQTRNYQGIV